MRAYVLLALWAVRPSLGGYDAADAVTFCFITQALIGPVQIFGGMDLTERIRNGDVAIDLYRPVGLQGWWLADDLGRAAAPAAARRTAAAGSALVFPFRAPAPANLAAFAVALVLAVTVGFGLRYLVALGMFWLHDDRGLQAVTLVMSLFFSGMILPLVVFPGRLGDIAQALPWAAQIQVAGGRVPRPAHRRRAPRRAGLPGGVGAGATRGRGTADAGRQAEAGGARWLTRC